MPASEYAIDRSEVLRYLGYRGQQLDPDLELLIGRVSDECIKNAEPRYCYEMFALDGGAPSPTLARAGLELLGEDIKEHLRGAVGCAVMAATLGIEVERVLVRLGLRSATEQLIYNAACTALIESVADACEEEIRRRAEASGLELNYRYSPGYGDFPLEQQPDILDSISAGIKIGVTLTDNYLMIPRKSVSAVIGLFPKGEAQGTHGSSCESCEMREDCEFRREGLSCGK